MKVWIVTADNGACGDPNCCGPSETCIVGVFSTEELARASARPWDDVDEWEVDA